MLKDFVNEHHLSTGNNHQISPMFYHFNGYVTSHIDYILCLGPELRKDYTFLERQTENSSPHEPVKAELNISTLAKCIVKIGNQIAPRKVFAWKKLDAQKYNAIIADMLPMCNNESMESMLTSLNDCLKNAAQKAVPSRIVKLKGPKKRVSPKVLECLKSVKHSYRNWVDAGKPHTGQLYIENKLAKNSLGVSNVLKTWYAIKLFIRI